MPTELHRALLAANQVQIRSTVGDNYYEFLDLYEARRSGYFRGLFNGESYREIYSREDVIRYLRGEMVSQYRGGHELPIDSAISAQRHVQSLVQLLRRFDSFEIALVDDAVLEHVYGCDIVIRLDAAGNGWLLMESCGPRRRVGSRGLDVDLVVEDHVVTQAVTAYFTDVWNSLPAASTSKELVVGVLEAELELAQQAIETAE